MDVNYQGEEMEVGFNVTYILDVLNALKCQQVRIRLTDASSSCLIETAKMQAQNTSLCQCASKNNGHFPLNC